MGLVNVPNMICFRKGVWVCVGLTFLLSAGSCSDIDEARNSATSLTPLSNPVFAGPDKNREQIPVVLSPVAEGFSELTDLQFVPGFNTLLAITEKGGRLRWIDLDSGRRGEWLSLDVLTASEQGLLGLAFHPDFNNNSRFFINYSTQKDGEEWSRVEMWQFTPNKDPRQITPQTIHVVMEVSQPYANHNAGQLAFGSDGYLYIGWGDGGAGGDPHNNGQNTHTLLGSMLRIDVDRKEGLHNYAIPADNPFRDNADFLPQIWAWGFRNPWRYSFDNLGRLIVADVGQNAWEEISIVDRANNYGWNIREGRHCFKPRTGCRTTGLTDPIFEYGHDEGNAITGGYVYLGEQISQLKNKYIFGDFGTGKIWALDLPQNTGSTTAKIYSLGKWPLLISTFGRDASGKIYVADYDKGVIYRLDPVK
jgi:glucose/arabinose dehydrogenase